MSFSPSPSPKRPLSEIGQIIQASIEQLHIAFPVTPTEYFDQMVVREQQHPVLELLPKPCRDCAVTCGFYQDFSNDLRDESPEMQMAVAQKWHCHNHPNRACRGNADNLGINW
jgi:hypothetical protein